MNILIFGAGHYGKALKEYIEQSMEYNLVGFLDNAVPKPSVKDAAGNPIPVYSPEDGVLQSYDKIIISNIDPLEIAEIKRQLASLGVNAEKVRVLFEDEDLGEKIIARTTGDYYDEEQDPRIRWLRDFAHYANECRMEGSVAECGVARGGFAQYINKYFPGKALYLFDTFEGFDEDDLNVERSFHDEGFLKGMFNKSGMFRPAHTQIRNEHIVMKLMPHPETCILKKGLFPDTAAGLKDTFCFVNLDMDLYQPMLAGLRFFYEKMCPGGVILLHDYFNPELPGIKRAVANFEREHGPVCKTTIGDFSSIAILKA